jgi:putative ABC transport system substrate-binding protein
MRRREFIAGLGAAAAAWPAVVRAQQPGRTRRVAVLFNVAENDPEGQAYLTVLEQALKTLGWTLGRDLTMEYYWTGGDFDRMRSSAVKLVGTAPDVILATNAPTLDALRRENHTIPTVFMFIVDPVLSGYIASLAHPGGNLTGLTHFEYSIGGKWLGILKEAAPRVARVGIVWNPQNINVGGFMKSIASAASFSGCRRSKSTFRTQTKSRAALALLQASPMAV